MLSIRRISKTFDEGTVHEKQILANLDLELLKGDYVTVIGGNGSGKSTLLNCIAGAHLVDCGRIFIDGVNVTRSAGFKRAKMLGRVFQDPLMGSSGNMTVEKNLALANRRGSQRGFKLGTTKQEKLYFKQILESLNLGLEKRLTTQVGLLSGGQRQALTLLMATIKKPKLLLLDEHTAALDPKTAPIVLGLSDLLIKENSLTALMVTHNLRDAIFYGNRLIMMHNGSIVLDARGEAKRKLTVEYLLRRFEQVSGTIFSEDRALLAQ